MQHPEYDEPNSRIIPGIPTARRSTENTPRPPRDQQAEERLNAVRAYAESLEHQLTGNTRHLATTIRKLAEGAITPHQAACNLTAER